MKQVLVIGAKDSGSKNNPDVVVEAMIKKGLQSSVVYWDDLVFEIETGEVSIKDVEGRELRSYSPDLVLAFGWYRSGKQSIYRDIAFSTAMYFDEHHIPYWNREMGHQRSVSKLSCMVQLALEGVSVPLTKFSINQTYISREKYPFIAKAVSASRGKDNYLLRESEDHTKLDTEQVFYLVQEYLENDHDLRVICFDGEPQHILKRSRPDGEKTHLNNVSQGGVGEWLNMDSVPQELLTISSKICKIMGREMAGIDFIPNLNSPYQYSCLEVNAIPQLTSGFDTEMKLESLSESVKRSII